MIPQEINPTENTAIDNFKNNNKLNLKTNIFSSIRNNLTKLDKRNLNAKNSLRKHLQNNSENTPSLTKWAYTLGIISIPSILLFGLYLLIPLSAIILSIISLIKFGSSKKAALGLIYGLIGIIASIAFFILVILPFAHMM